MQQYPYDDDLSYHFLNLALLGEVQPIWEAEEPKHPDLDDPFAIPQKYYPNLFLGSQIPMDDLFSDIQGYVRETYELVGALRIGEGVVSDYEDQDTNWAGVQIDSFDHMLKMFSSYSQRVSEAFNNNIRYSFSHMLIGYALRSRVDGHGVIALRGTATTEEWFNNMNYRLVPFYPQETQYGVVHNGFRDIYKGIRGRYRELIQLFDPAAPLYLVGHSLGAAVSQLAALDIAVKSPERAAQLRVYGYAPPRVGDEAFTSVYNQLVGTSYRVVNICDIVPYVPFEEIGTLMRQQGYPYTSTKGDMSYVHQTGNPLANHISSYHLATRLKIPAPMDASMPGLLP